MLERTANGRNYKATAVKNIQLVRRARMELDNLTVALGFRPELAHVYGHSNIAGNDRADVLAKRGAHDRHVCSVGRWASLCSFESTSSSLPASSALPPPSDIPEGFAQSSWIAAGAGQGVASRLDLRTAALGFPG